MSSVPTPELAAQSQSAITRHYTMSDGLPGTVVNWVLQDSRGFMWLATFNGLSKFDGYEFTNYSRNPASRHTLGHNVVTRLWEDRYGRLWVGHVAGLDLFNPQTEEFYNFPPEGNSKWVVNRFRERRDGKLWICAGDGVYIADIERLSLEKMPKLPEDNYWDIAESNNGSVWAAGEQSVIHVDATTDQISSYKHDFKDPDGLATGTKGFSILVDEKEKVWIGGSGLKLFNENSKSFIHHLNGYRVRHILSHSDGELLIGHDFGISIFDPKSKRHVNIANEWPTSILTDRQGIIWYSSFAGLKQIYHDAGKFRKEEQFGFVGGIVEDGVRDIWIFSDAGIFRYDPSFRKVLQHKPLNSVQAMTVNGEGSVVLISGDKLERYDFRSKTISGQPLSVTDRKRDISTISFVDSFGNIWTGGWAGVGKYNPRTNAIQSLNVFPDAPVFHYLEDRHKNLWIASRAGLWRYNLISDKLDIFENDPADRQSLPDNRVHHIIMDKSQTIWIGTSTGLSKILEGTENGQPKFKSWNTRTSGLPVDNVSCIVEGADGSLWLACGNMISHFNPSNNTFRNYFYTDFATPTRFTSGFTMGKGLRTSSGKIIFGTMREGLVIFDPDSLIDNTYAPPIVITDFLINNQHVPIAKTEADTVALKTPLQKGISYTNDLRLTYVQNDFAFQFSGLNYVNPENNQYKYKLEPYEDEWITTTANNRIARYTNISPGHYTFRVIGSNNDGLWNEEGTSLSIIITPPWWQTWWAYSGYTLIALVAFVTWRRYENKRVVLKHRAEHLAELDTLKSRFFANISHEFRTPITLILGPLKKLYNKASAKEDKEELEIMLRNSERLHRLINQLLDLSKIEAGKMRLQASSVELVQFVREIAAAYESLATEKQIKFMFSPEADELIVYIDPEKIEKVVHNLLSNAFKFTKSGGEVILFLRQEKDLCLITVKDTGIGIPADQLDKVFDRFYQVDSSQTRGYEGSGLGMALAKELVELHKGKISVQSTQGKGTTFTVTLPSGKEHLSREELAGQLHHTEREVLSDMVVRSENGSNERKARPPETNPYCSLSRTTPTCGTTSAKH